MVPGSVRRRKPGARSCRTACGCSVASSPTRRRFAKVLPAAYRSMKPGGAHAVKSIDLVRFQVARNRGRETGHGRRRHRGPGGRLSGRSRRLGGPRRRRRRGCRGPRRRQRRRRRYGRCLSVRPDRVEGPGRRRHRRQRRRRGPGSSPRSGTLRCGPPWNRPWARSRGAPITAEDLSALTMLTVQFQPIGEEIRDLTGLEQAANLAELELSFNAVADLSPLSGLEGLEILRLAGNEIADLGPLRGLASLRELWVTYNPVSDLSPLSQLNLGSLDVSRTSVSLDDVLGLPRSRGLSTLSVGGLGNRRPGRAVRVLLARDAGPPGQPGFRTCRRCATCPPSDRWISGTTSCRTSLRSRTFPDSGSWT